MTVDDRADGPNTEGERVSELIGRYTVGEARANVYKSRAYAKNIDQTIPDYEFYDKLRRGKAKGYSLGGLFCKRIEQIFTSWVLGRGVEITLQKEGNDEINVRRRYTDSLLGDFLNDAHADLMQLYRDAVGLGDQYAIVNSDGSLSIPSPDAVTVEHDRIDYRSIISLTVEMRTGELALFDEYRADGRTLTIKEGADGRSGSVVSVQEFPNLIGRLPVVHLANGRSANETNGHSIHETLRPLYDQYDDLIYKQLDGAKLLGNPLLAFTGMEDINAVINANEPAEADTYTDKDGNTATRTQLNIDSSAVLLVGKGGVPVLYPHPSALRQTARRRSRVSSTCCSITPASPSSSGATNYRAPGHRLKRR